MQCGTNIQEVSGVVPLSLASHVRGIGSGCILLQINVFRVIACPSASLSPLLCHLLPLVHQEAWSTKASVMSDWVLLGLIAVLVMLLLLTVFGFAVYSGLFTEVVVSAGSPPVGSITLAYKFRVGPYGESGQLFTDGCSISSKLCSIGVYYDNPHTVSPEKCRFAIGRILSEGDAKPSEEQIKRFQKYGFKIFSFPAPSHVVMATFPFTTPLSIHLAINRVHPALDTYIKGCTWFEVPRSAEQWWRWEDGSLAEKDLESRVAQCVSGAFPALHLHTGPGKHLAYGRAESGWALSLANLF
ncbi:testis-expressed protein 264 isoform 4-T29 [Amazona ochrocephala]